MAVLKPKKSSIKKVAKVPSAYPVRGKQKAKYYLIYGTKHGHKVEIFTGKEALKMRVASMSKRALKYVIRGREMSVSEEKKLILET